VPVFAIIVGTYALWITAKGELGKYLSLATTKATPAQSAPLPTGAASGAGTIAGAAAAAGSVGGLAG
jgi:hypothetical protein